MKTRLRLEKFTPPAGLELRTARSAGRRLTYWAIEVPRISYNIDETLSCWVKFIRH